MTLPNTERWTKRQAQEFFDLVTGRVAARSQEFVEALGGAEGPATEAARREIESLVPVWSWFVSWLARGSPHLPRTDAATTPPWHAADRGSPLGPEQLWGVDGLACLYAEVALRALPGAVWQLLQTNRRDVDNLRPVIAGPGFGYMEPFGFIYAATLRASEGVASFREPTKLAARLAHLRDLAMAAAPPPPELLLSDLLDLHVHDGTTWLAIDDDLRVMIGEEALDGLQTTLLEVPGIRSVERSDTELFILSTDREPETLRLPLVELMERLRDANPGRG